MATATLTTPAASANACECFGVREVPLWRGLDAVGSIPVLRPRFADYLGYWNGKVVVHGDITDDGIVWDDERE